MVVKGSIILVEWVGLKVTNRVRPIVAEMRVVIRVYFKIFFKSQPTSFKLCICVRVETIAKKIIGKLISFSMFKKSSEIMFAKVKIKGIGNKEIVAPSKMEVRRLRL